MKERIPRKSPFRNPTFISFKTRLNFCFAVSVSSTRTRMVTARDWVPTFPAISRIRDWKHITMGSTATTVSNTPTTEDTAMPRNSRMISHGRRFLILVDVFSCRSSSAVKLPQYPGQSEYRSVFRCQSEPAENLRHNL